MVRGVKHNHPHWHSVHSATGAEVGKGTNKTGVGDWEGGGASLAGGKKGKVC